MTAVAALKVDLVHVTKEDPESGFYLTLKGSKGNKGNSQVKEQERCTADRVNCYSGDCKDVKKFSSNKCPQRKEKPQIQHIHQEIVSNEDYLTGTELTDVIGHYTDLDVVSVGAVVVNAMNLKSIAMCTASHNNYT